ncbi:bifunctional tetrahydrofolate synthase/dihydrofolate synthase [Rubrivivax benzoatilyticus]|uniref:Dihydrofolate synthase/folylpolyglutamate synthase n=1 Tax=Rubrivivax benzoatilyticus TaxID=316997 RepID=A0ABX0HQK5_9BURK|nr:bifunctional tetrahydrofolate synthase/dihydrofolate synthase [Rubrivivax benzoatilyticus]EGJ08860.1 FolC bifunctional protein [Rubrivivax benzoatilyticus JA2 = ATCC BAA-35]NHK97356.1 bifunctional tetrahydrofolate synthase/dihydrofolate synthase [Rubrivivax benzoatilyticus]NHL22949.1 bifunctional tetrahydrofolate synthase/dihydrofolate synthase [Rubrivivax benzoatilyticus]
MTALPATLDDWLAHCERMHPISMDLSLERTVEVRRRLGLEFTMPLIVVAGTNGKGSTCAMLESIAMQAGYRVGLYQKPELVHFTERCRVDGRPVDADALLPHFDAVEQARGDITLTKFEFTTLAIARLLSLAPLDLVILEVGLGGRYDAVNAFDADCTVITSIDLDHTEFLGPDRESIGFEKAHVMRTGRPAIVGDPLPPASVVDHAREIGADLWLAGRDFRHDGDRQQWNWAGRGRRYNGLGYPALRGANQLLNASAALAAFESLRERLPITAQAVRTGLALVDLPGRFQVVPGQPALVLDVAHNPQSVAALALNLDAMGFYPRTRAVFGAMRDKDIAGALAKIRPLIDEWHVCALPTARAATADELAAVLGDTTPVHRHATPSEALRAALAASDPADRIVVFGSFYTVGGVLRDGLPRLSAPHAG